MRYLEFIENGYKTLFQINQLVNVVHADGGGTVIVLKICAEYHTYRIRETFSRVKYLINEPINIITLNRCYKEYPNNVLPMRVLK